MLEEMQSQESITVGANSPNYSKLYNSQKITKKDFTKMLGDYPESGQNDTNVFSENLAKSEVFSKKNDDQKGRKNKFIINKKVDRSQGTSMSVSNKNTSMRSTFNNEPQQRKTYIFTFNSLDFVTKEKEAVKVNFTNKHQMIKKSRKSYKN